jgi:predicted porin
MHIRIPTGLAMHESALGPDTGAGAIASRDTRVRLEGQSGTVFLGHWSTPYTSATSGLDPFYPTTAGYAGIMGNGSTSSADNISDTSAFDRRQQNSIAFWSASAHGMSLRLAHGLNEEKPATGARPSLTSAAVIYDAGPWYLTLAHERHHEYQGRGSNDLGTKFGAAYRFSPTRLGALSISAIVERLRYETISGRLARRAYFLSVTDQIGPHSLRLTVAKAAEASGQLGQQVGRVRAGADSGALHLTLGYDYALSNRSSVFAYLTRLRNGENGVVDFGTNALGISTGARLEGAAVGLRHWF